MAIESDVRSRDVPLSSLIGDPSRRRLLGMSWSHFLNDGTVNYLPGVLPAVLVALHIPLALAGTVMAALLFGQALQPLAGWLADRAGGRGFVIAGLAGSSLGGALIGLAPDYWMLLVVLALIGVSNSLFHPQALAAVRSLDHRRQGLSMSVFLVGGELGRGAWPFFASLVVVWLGLHALWVLELPALITLPFLFHWLPRLPARHPEAARIAWRRHLKDIALLVTYAGLRATVTFAVATFVPLLWRARGGSLVGGASLITTMLVIGIIGNLGGGYLADRLGRRPVMVSASLLSALLLALFLYAHGPWLWVSLAALGIAVFATLPVTILMGQDILPENRSLGSGLALGLANGLGAVAVFLLGPLAAAWSIESVLWISVLLSVISAPLALFLPEHRATVRRHVSPAS